jgi:uncharacterized protein
MGVKIALVGLSAGLHTLNFVKERSEFGLENHPNLCRDVQIHVELEKRPPHYFLKNTVRTVARFHCDRCLNEFDCPLSEESRVIYSSDPEVLATRDDADIHFIDPQAKELDITDEIRDSLLIAIPMKLVCSENCRGICAGCGADLNEETCRCAERPSDPRWEPLRKLL